MQKEIKQKYPEIARELRVWKIQTKKEIIKRTEYFTLENNVAGQVAGQIVSI